jgi:biopolymer transport protein ExbD
MADIDQSNRGSDGGSRRKVHGIKIDMTPLVDLAFLLLTFFILTRTFQEKRILEVNWPDKPTALMDLPPVSAENVLNLVLAEDDKLYWWIWSDPKPKTSDFSKDGLRKLLIDQRKANPKIVVLIKPKDSSKYSNLVDVLDEIQITKTPRYVLMDFSPEDEKVIDDALLAHNR